jgi:hypothetical protein
LSHERGLNNPIGKEPHSEGESVRVKIENNVTDAPAYNPTAVTDEENDLPITTTEDKVIDDTHPTAPTPVTMSRSFKHIHTPA